MTVNTASGAKLFIGTANSNRSSALADYVADSYIEVGEVEDLGEFGDESERIKFTALSDGRSRSFKGPRDAGEMTMVVGDDPTDEGQLALEAAEASPLDFNFYVQLNDAISLGGQDSKHYFIGKVFSKRRNVGNASNVVRRNFAIGINSAVTSTDPT
jgi:hypothetical protein